MDKLGSVIAAQHPGLLGGSPQLSRVRVAVLKGAFHD